MAESIAIVVLKEIPAILTVVDEWFPIFQGSKDWWSFE